jgi:hypothetical protein
MTAEDLKTVEKLIDLAKKHGVRRVRFEDVELELGPAAPEPLTPKALRELREMFSHGQPSDEDLLYWSAGGAPVGAPLPAAGEGTDGPG